MERKGKHTQKFISALSNICHSTNIFFFLSKETLSLLSWCWAFFSVFPMLTVLKVNEYVKQTIFSHFMNNFFVFHFFFIWFFIELFIRYNFPNFFIFIRPVMFINFPLLYFANCTKWILKKKELIQKRNVNFLIIYFVSFDKTFFLQLPRSFFSIYMIMTIMHKIA